MEKTIVRVLHYGIRLAALAVMVLAYMYFSEPNPVTLKPFPFEVPAVIYKGEIFSFEFERCSDYRVEYTFNSYLEDVKIGTRYYMQAAPVVAEEGCFIITSLPKLIPNNVHSGNLKIKYEIKVFGKMRSHYIEHETSSFEYIRD